MSPVFSVKRRKLAEWQNRSANRRNNDNNNMPEKKTIEVTVFKKMDSPGDPKTKQKEADSGKKTEEVGGRGHWVSGFCPNCGSYRQVFVSDFSTDWYECGNCHHYYKA